MRLPTTLFIGALFVSGAALAHGTRPRAIDVHPQRGDGETLIVSTLVRGAYAQTGEGGEFHWICPAAYDNLSFDDALASLALSDGGWAMVHSYGIRITEDGGCSWSVLEGPWEDRRISKATVHPQRPDQIWVTTSQGGVSNAIYRSDDRGESWETAGLESESEFYRDIAIHPESGRVFAVSFDLEEERYRLYLSDDEGESWIYETLPDAGLASYRIVGMDPEEDQRIFLKAIDSESAQLWLSEDAGGEFVDLLKVAGDFGAIWFEGPTVLLGRLMQGVYLSDDGGRTWTDDREEPGLYCAVESESDRFACRDLTDHIAVDRAPAGSLNFEPFFDYADAVGPLTCPEGTSVAIHCGPEVWTDHQREMGEWGVEITVGGGGDDEGGGGGGSCRQAPSPSGRLEIPFALLTIVLLYLRSRKLRSTSIYSRNP